MPAELFDVQAANIELIERKKADAIKRWAAGCGAKSTAAFEWAAEGCRQELEEIERAGKCVACGWNLNGHTTCRECGREQ